MSKFWKWFKSLFTKDNVGIVWSIILTSTKSAIANALRDPVLQDEALSIVRQLGNTGMSSDAKITAFAERLEVFAKKLGRTLTEKAITELRRNAYAAYQIENEEAAACSTCND